MIIAKTSQQTRILRELRDKKFVTSIALNRICYRYSARIHELRKEGWNIQRSYERPGVWRYWLVDEPEYPETY